MSKKGAQHKTRPPTEVNKEADTAKPAPWEGPNKNEDASLMETVRRIEPNYENKMKEYTSAQGLSHSRSKRQSLEPELFNQIMDTLNKRKDQIEDYRRENPIPQYEIPHALSDIAVIETDYQRSRQEYNVFAPDYVNTQKEKYERYRKAQEIAKDLDHYEEAVKSGFIAGIQDKYMPEEVGEPPESEPTIPPRKRVVARAAPKPRPPPAPKEKKPSQVRPPRKVVAPPARVATPAIAPTVEVPRVKLELPDKDGRSYGRAHDPCEDPEYATSETANSRQDSKSVDTSKSHNSTIVTIMLTPDKSSSRLHFKKLKSLISAGKSFGSLSELLNNDKENENSLKSNKRSSAKNVSGFGNFQEIVNYPVHKSDSSIEKSIISLSKDSDNQEETDKRSKTHKSNWCTGLKFKTNNNISNCEYEYESSQVLTSNEAIKSSRNTESRASSSNSWTVNNSYSRCDSATSLLAQGDQATAHALYSKSTNCQGSHVCPDSLAKGNTNSTHKASSRSHRPSLAEDRLSNTSQRSGVGKCIPVKNKPLPVPVISLPGDEAGSSDESWVENDENIPQHYEHNYAQRLHPTIINASNNYNWNLQGNSKNVQALGLNKFLTVLQVK